MPAFFEMMLARIEAKLTNAAKLLQKSEFKAKSINLKRRSLKKNWKKIRNFNVTRDFLLNYERAELRPNQNDFDRAAKFAKEAYDAVK